MSHHRETGSHNRPQSTWNKRVRTEGRQKEFQHPSPLIWQQLDWKSVKVGPSAWPLVLMGVSEAPTFVVLWHILFTCTWFVYQEHSEGCLYSHMPSHIKGLHWKGIKLYKDFAFLRDSLSHLNSEQELDILQKPQLFWTPSAHWVCEAAKASEFPACPTEKGWTHDQTSLSAQRRREKIRRKPPAHWRILRGPLIPRHRVLTQSSSLQASMRPVKKISIGWETT